MQQWVRQKGRSARASTANGRPSRAKIAHQAADAISRRDAGGEGFCLGYHWGQPGPKKCRSTTRIPFGVVGKAVNLAKARLRSLGRAGAPFSR